MVVVCVGGVIWEMLTGRERRRICVIKSGIENKDDSFQYIIYF